MSRKKPTLFAPGLGQRNEGFITVGDLKAYIADLPNEMPLARYDDAGTNCLLKICSVTVTRAGRDYARGHFKYDQRVLSLDDR